MNCKRPSPRTSRALAPGVKRIVRSAFGRSVGPTDELTATIQSARDAASKGGRHMGAVRKAGLELEPGLINLEVGAGSGYHAATIAEQNGPGGHVYTIEQLTDLVDFARKNLERARYSDRVTLVQGDGSLGYKDRAPYDRILVTAAAPKIPEPLLEQLRPRGILLVPVGGRLFPQELVKAEKGPDGHVKKSSLGGVAFVPLIGEHGFEA